MPVINQEVPFLPSQNNIKPPIKLLDLPIDGHGGQQVYLWYITEDEYLRLNKLFVGRDFQDTGLGGTKVMGVPVPCKGCGKYTEFIDWVWTALRRGVHTPDFMFNALKHGRQGAETMHDVYCSACGMITPVRSRDNAEGGEEAPTIELAKPLERSKYDLLPELMEFKSMLQAAGTKEPETMRWGDWWLDNTGSTAAYRARIAKEKAESEAKLKAEQNTQEEVVSAA